jgi:1-aminocyclopropane-1-carboxylate deaminase/D-cysteine desulfhydrase-like pyridoxal-dependent ACC family enzyme
VLGVSVTRSPDAPSIAACAVATAELITGRATTRLPAWRLADGRTEDASDLADRLLVRGGFVADPVYNAKALRWLAAHRSETEGPLVYWATGGLLAASDLLTKEDSR